ncbi:hypothetical protein COCNU_14G004490 [Cocos nucifera]|uniref:ATP-dependent Clp protease proteolytic subunit n=1 Tax=Cocos nucifera TaxID=13894 RepID=A0A8K0IUL4_COCNU|nr:hypothetical protein COCNU_14G004490 [Cocos nucifera]
MQSSNQAFLGEARSVDLIINRGAGDFVFPNPNLIVITNPNWSGTRLFRTCRGFLFSTANSPAGRYVKPPIFTLCVGNAWGEAALLLAAGAKGNRAALPSSTIMIKQPIARFQGQATDVDLARKEIKNVKAELVALYSKHIGKPPEQIEEDIRRPKYFSPSEAVEYGIIDKVLYNERGREDRSVVSDLKRAQLI